MEQPGRWCSTSVLGEDIKGGVHRISIPFASRVWCVCVCVCVFGEFVSERVFFPARAVQSQKYIYTFASVLRSPEGCSAIFFSQRLLVLLLLLLLLLRFLSYILSRPLSQSSVTRWHGRQDSSEQLFFLVSNGALGSSIHYHTSIPASRGAYTTQREWNVWPF